MRGQSGSPSRQPPSPLPPRLLPSSAIVAGLNVVPGVVSTNALSTSKAMDNELSFVQATEAALLVGPVAAVLSYQAFLRRRDAAAALATGSAALATLSAKCRACSRRVCARRADPAPLGPGPLEELLHDKLLPDDPEEGGGVQKEQGGAV